MGILFRYILILGRQNRNNYQNFDNFLALIRENDNFQYQPTSTQAPMNSLNPVLRSEISLPVFERFLNLAALTVALTGLYLATTILPALA